jgi:sarcosine oxidase subunit alpha
MSGQSHRLPSGGRIDRGRPLRFTFDGRAYTGFDGDTLASALLANGVRVVGRSFRLHRARGVMSAGLEEPNAIVQVGRGALTEPNLKATEVLLYDGLEARAVNAWPNAAFDLAAVTGLFAPLLSPGFYYKTFLWPRWGFYSGLIRRMGGLGLAPREPDPSRYEKAFETCDVLVIGGGAAGLAAAVEAGADGARVILVDDKPELGGAAIGETDFAEVEQVLGARPETRVLKRAVALGWYDHNLITVVEDLTGNPGPRQRFWKIRAGRVVLATGAYERPLVFPGNDRPGVMLAGAARAYALRFGVAAGRRAVVVTNNDQSYQTALDLLDAGVGVVALADLRPEAGPLAEALRARGVQVLAGHGAVATHGGRGVKAIDLAPLDGAGQRVRIACDLVCMSGGWNPVVHLFSQSGGSVTWDPASRAFVPLTWRQAGEATGDAAAAKVPVGGPWSMAGDGPAFVDFQNDVTAGDIRSAAQEHYVSVEHLKRYTTLGMALDQGKTSNVNAIGVLSQILQKPEPRIGTTRFRPPFSPVTVGALAGRRLGDLFHGLRRLPAEAEHRTGGARLEDYGGWLRPAGYPLAGEAEETMIRREVSAVRKGVGLYDASPLGKLVVAGPDAAEFLQRIYANNLKTLAVGRCRYGLMLDEHGAVLDDGVVMRLAANRFLVGTTSGGAGRIGLWLEEWLQCEWPDLDVVVENVTSQWATVNLAGPQAGTILRALGLDAVINDQALSHMAFSDGLIDGAPCHIARVSFTGERSYEISVPADRGAALWRACLEAGAASGIVPFGVEALMRLRLEKGFLHVGVDTDPTTYPEDIGYGRVGRAKVEDFIGRRSTLRENAADRRRRLVGVQSDRAIGVGAHVLGADGMSQGWITSAGFSPTLGRYVALALVEEGASRHGETVTLFDRGARSEARLGPLCAYDPEGARLNA